MPQSVPISIHLRRIARGGGGGGGPGSPEPLNFFKDGLSNAMYPPKVRQLAEDPM